MHHATLYGNGKRQSPCKQYFHTALNRNISIIHSINSIFYIIIKALYLFINRFYKYFKNSDKKTYRLSHHRTAPWAALEKKQSGLIPVIFLIDFFNDFFFFKNGVKLRLKEPGIGINK